MNRKEIASAQARMATDQENSLTVYRNALLRLMAELEGARGTAVTCAVTSIHPGDGVTFMVREMAAALRTVSTYRVASVSLAELESTQDIQVHAAHTSNGHGQVYGSEGWVVPRAVRDGLAQLTAHHDIVLIDCPPVQPGGPTLLVAPGCSGVILVVRAGATSRTEVQAAEQRLAATGANLYGFILNTIKRSIFQRLFS